VPLALYVNVGGFSSLVSSSPNSRHKFAACAIGSVSRRRVSRSRTFALRIPAEGEEDSARSFRAVDERRTARVDVDILHMRH